MLLFFLSFTVMVASPSAIAVITPLRTLATFLSDDVQLNVYKESSFVVAVIVSSSPTFQVTSVLETVSPTSVSPTFCLEDSVDPWLFSPQEVKIPPKVNANNELRIMTLVFFIFFVFPVCSKNDEKPFLKKIVNRRFINNYCKLYVHSLHFLLQRKENKQVTFLPIFLNMTFLSL